MSGAAIRAENLSKQYRIGERLAPYRTFRESLANIFKRPDRARAQTIWALKDITFEVKKGETVGIIGKNGAGKTTLLKVLSRITEPTRGRAFIDGSVSSLLEAGMNFHPELTGRENIYFNGAILGMRKRDIDKRFDEIVSFAEVERFIDTPMKRYSSGMHLRLAFAIGAHLQPDILLLDEVLAVGDADFQAKCFGKMEDVNRAGRTILFVSHDMGAVRRLCRKAMLLENGMISYYSDAQDAVSRYLSTVKTAQAALPDLSERRGRGRVRITGITLLGLNEEPVGVAMTGFPLKIAFDYKKAGLAPEGRATITFTILDNSGAMITACSTAYMKGPRHALKDEGRAVCLIPKLPLAEGLYTVNFKVSTARYDIEDECHKAFTFRVETGDFFGSGASYRTPAVYVDHDWEWR